MNRGKRPVHSIRHGGRGQGGRGERGSSDRSGEFGNGQGHTVHRPHASKGKRQRFEDEPELGRKSKAVSFAPQQLKKSPRRPPVAVDQTKTPSRADTEAPVKRSDSLASPPRSFTIVVGSYEKLLYGIDGSFPSTSKYTPGETIQPTLTPIFIFPAHVSCVKAVAASPEGGKWLATGSTDETVKVWDLRRRKEIGGLMHHQGSITHLSFPSRSHLMTASEDGTLCLFHARDWVLLRTFKGHKGRVNSVAVHPSGKLALSVGKDRTIRMWDLMRGKASASTKLGQEAEQVRWSPRGQHFAVQTQATIDLYRTDMSLIQTISHPSRIHDIAFCLRSHASSSDDELLLVAAEDKKTSVYMYQPSGDASQKPSNDESSARDTDILPEAERDNKSGYYIVAELVGHENRVKAIDTLRISLPSSSNQMESTTTILASASSDGKIHVYDLTQLSTDIVSRLKDERPVQQLAPIALYDTKGSRLTCLTLADGEVSRSKVFVGDKRKAPMSEAESEEDNADGGISDESEGDEETKLGSDAQA